MKKFTPFRIAAMRFAKGVYRYARRERAGYYNPISYPFSLDYYGACEALWNTFTDEDNQRCIISGKERHVDFFQKYFTPSHDEMRAYNTDGFFFMTSRNRTGLQNRNDRILALLLCEQIWLDEQGKNKSK